MIHGSSGAIPTRYKGYFCRSRLEARWLVFFTTLRFDFWYEPGGFQFSDGSRYLPDLYLPQVRMFAEVKPELPAPAEMVKAEALCRLTEKPCILLCGPPDFKTYDAVFFDCGEVTTTDVLLDINYHDRTYYDQERRLFTSCGNSWTSEADFTDQYRAAVYASRAERFEVAS